MSIYFLIWFAHSRRYIFKNKAKQKQNGYHSFFQNSMVERKGFKHRIRNSIPINLVLN